MRKGHASLLWRNHFSYYIWDQLVVRWTYLCVNISNQHVFLGFFSCWSCKCPPFALRKSSCNHSSASVAHAHTPPRCSVLDHLRHQFSMHKTKTLVFEDSRKSFYKAESTSGKNRVKMTANTPWTMKWNKKSVLSLIISDFSISRRQGI